MKKKLIYLTTSIVAITIPLTPVLTSCSCNQKEKELSDYFDIETKDNEVILNGFKSDISQDDIKKKFNDTLTIPSEVTTIANNSFYNPSTNESKIPSFMTKLQWGQKYSKLHTIGDNAFNGWKGLSKLSINNKITTIGDSAFKNCSNLSYIDLEDFRTQLPDSTKWGNDIFKNVAQTGSVSILVQEQDPVWKSFLGSKGIDFTKWETKSLVSIYSYDDSGNELLGFYKSLELSEISDILQGQTSLSIPSQAKTIGQWAFYDVNKVHTTIPDFITNLDLSKANQLTEIKNYAFERCPAETITGMPSSLTKIGMGAFDTSNLKSFDFTYIKEIGPSAFSQTKLTDVDLSSTSINKIDSSAFSNIMTLNSFKFPTNWTNTKLGDYMFGWSTYLTKVDNWPSILTFIGDGMFYGCEYLDQSNIQSIINSPNITEIGMFSFRECLSLYKLVIPSNINTIKEGAFQDCNYLEEIDLSAISADIPSGFSAKDTFKGLAESGKIIVNNNCSDQQLESWKTYFKGFGLEFETDKWTIEKAQ